MNAPISSVTFDYSTPDATWLSWPLRFEKHRDGPFIRDVLQTIRADAERSDDLAWYWAAQAALDNLDSGVTDFTDIEELIEQEAEAERIASIAYRYETRTGREWSEQFA